MFWIAASSLVLMTMLAVYIPLNRASKPDTTKPALIGALAAELNEVNADKGLRFANAAEADAARAEIGRRLLALEAAPATVKTQSNTSQLFAIFALVPILAIPIYLELGKPEYPGQSSAMRTDQETIAVQPDVNEIIARVENRLSKMPQDAQGWALIAPVYYRSGRVEDALEAYTRALEFHQGNTASRSQLIADRAEILVAQAEGQVTPDAAKAFADAIKIDPANQKALFYNVIRLEQAGEAAAAKANWEGLIARFEPINPPWLAVAKQRLTGLNAQLATGSEKRVGGPNAAGAQAAQEMTPAERQDMIKGMVDGLAARLIENPRDADGWLQLIRSRKVLGDTVQLTKDLETARSTFATGTADRAAIDALATKLGI